ncbi:restriction endonuclease subunit S [Picosynechococcus sp. PCC 7117]|uniref:restriction endonuclease subunit S n=1 Tax=Picosynechococcus sp. PCC 7117 TaxID=195498 RepID=UPI0008109FC5|nr:restriction endonuclease subunit S [Picosynechococcus sp. PCC 7117]ANV88874.1 hypothetical protein AWQ22_14800 [Picosynechococcus sp. PCC 7117]
MSEWKKIQLKELIDIKHGYAFKGEFFSEVPSNNLLLTPGNFYIGGGFKDDKFKYYVGNIPNEYILSEGDVIVTMTDLSKAGDTLGYSAKIPKSDKLFLHNQRLGLIEIISDKVDKDFIYWLLRTRNYQKTIVNSCSGSTVKHTSPTKIRDYNFLCPPLEEQKAIAAVLSCLDAKIENLRKQNETLEAIAQTLFKHWFIDFEFPFDFAQGKPNEDDKPYKSSGGAMIPSELGEIPEGWRVGQFSDFFDLLSGGTPKTSIPEYWNGNIKWLSAKDVTRNHAGFILETEKTITELGIKKSAAKILPQYTTIVSARGTVGNYCMLSEEMAISQSNFGVIAKEKNKIFYGFLLISSLIERLKKSSYGSVFDTVTARNFKELKIITPDKQKIITFENAVKPIYNKILLHSNEIQTLTKTRDTLLPKLMSGQLRVKDLSL